MTLNHTLRLTRLEKNSSKKIVAEIIESTFLLEYFTINLIAK